MMRPSVAAPTGTEMPFPVFLTVSHWRSPSDAPMAMQRTMPAQLLLYFQRQVHVIEDERIVDFGNLIARKFHVDDRADDLHDFAATAGHVY